MTVRAERLTYLELWATAGKLRTERGNYKVKAWPALVDERDSVGSNCLIIRWNKSRQCGTVFASTATEYSIADQVFA